jgi:hypothetical protein
VSLNLIPNTHLKGHVQVELSQQEMLLNSDSISKIPMLELLVNASVTPGCFTRRLCTQYRDMKLTGHPGLSSDMRMGILF